MTGCETVNDSQYSTFAGIPVAVFGLAASVAILIGASVWWRRADIRVYTLPTGSDSSACPSSPG